MGLFDIVGDLVDAVKDAANDYKEKNQIAYEEIMRRPACYNTASMAIRRANSGSFSEKAGYNRALKEVLYELDDMDIIKLFERETLGICQGTVCQALENRGYMRRNSEDKYEKTENWPY